MNFLKIKNKGSVIMLVLIFSGIFVTIFSGTVGFFLIQHRAQVKRVNKEMALQVAEAGVNYYKWFLSHYPDDLKDKTGIAGPYEHEYYDPEGSMIGKFSLDVSGNMECDAVTSIDITSTGWTEDDPGIKRVLKARYARPSIAKYAYITNENIWFGVGEDVSGTLHSNGGIKMDGNNDSLISSAKDLWNCPPNLGCSSPYEEKPGIFGTGAGSSLWQFPTTLIDFVGISVDLSNMKSLAISSGIYLPKSITIDASSRGYHLYLKNDGTVDVYIIRNLARSRAWDAELNWHWNYDKIASEYFYMNYELPASCGLMFVEDNIWIEGEVSGKQTIVSANLVDVGVSTETILNDNITYTTLDGSDGLLLMSEGNISIPFHSPDIFTLNGIFISQEGKFGRDYYQSSVKTSLNLYGSVINKKTGTNAWVNESGTVLSGYETSVNSYDRKLMVSPPPLTPSADNQYDFVKWEEL